MSGKPVQGPVGASSADNQAAGMLLMVLAMSLIPLMDGIAKLLSARYPTLEIVWARYFFNFILLFPFVLWFYGRRTFQLRRPLLQVVRGLMLMMATTCFFGAIAFLPLADTLAIVFIHPFIVTALSPLLLGDKVGVWRWSAVVVGFIGALIIIQPGFQELSPAMLMALGAGGFYAFYVLITRKMAGSDPPLITLLMTSVVGTVVMTPLQPMHWVTPDALDLALMMSIGAIAIVGHYMIIVAHEWASAPQLAPYSYVEMISATALGYIMFNHLPGVLTWVGMAIIAASGIVVAWREAVQLRHARRARQVL